MDGYIKLHRKTFNNFLWEEKRSYSRFEAWLDILRSARFLQHTEKVLIKDKVLHLNRGEVRASQRFLVRRWGWTLGRVNRFLAMLETESMIERRVEHGETVIKVTKYDFYNPLGSDGWNTDRTASGTQTEHKQEQTKESNKEKNIIIGNYGSLLTQFHRCCEVLPKVIKLTVGRKKALDLLIKEHSLDDIKNTFVLVGESHFLNGDNGRGWKASFDWIIKPDNFVKIQEGKYDNRGGKSKVYRPDTSWEQEIDNSKI